MSMWKIPIAVAAGNTVVLKTSEITPLSMLYFALLVKQVGFPPGVINIVSGFGATAGAALASHKKLPKLPLQVQLQRGKLFKNWRLKI